MPTTAYNVKLEEQKAKNHRVNRIQHQHQKVQNLFQLLRQSDSGLMNDDNFADTSLDCFIIHKRTFQVILQLCKFTLNVLHVRCAVNQNVNEENFDSIKHLREHQHVWNGDQDEGDVPPWVFSKFEAVADGKIFCIKYIELWSNTH